MRQLWNESWDVNVTGTQILTDAFVPLLLKSSNPRLMFIASGTSSMTNHSNQTLPLDKLSPPGWPKANFAETMTGFPAYRSSKTGMNMMMREWDRLLRNDGVKVWCISPGFLATGLGQTPEANKKMGGGDPVPAGDFVRDVVEGSRDHDAGKVISKNGVQPW